MRQGFLQLGEQVPNRESSSTSPVIMNARHDGKLRPASVCSARSGRWQVLSASQSRI